MYRSEDQPAEGEPPDEDQYERVYVGRGDRLVDGADLRKAVKSLFGKK